MNQVLKLLSFIFLIGLMVPACTIEKVDDDDDTSSDISNQTAQGFTDANEPFTTVTALVENKTLFGDPGYYFHLYRDTISCGNFLNGDVSFFIESDVLLTEGDYDANGPFITNTSFFGADVVITSVTETTISGKVKGGDFEGDKNIEGSFVAEICD